MLLVLAVALIAELICVVVSVVAPQHRRRLRVPVIVFAVVGVAAAIGVLST